MRRELAIDEISRLIRSIAGNGGALDLAANRALEAKFTHQPLDSASGDTDIFAVELRPNLRRAIHTEVLDMHTCNLDLQLIITTRPSRHR
ncbi:hypothetical protein OAM92_00320 [Acidimicrobiales bacterium]|nr:hypothetical protein [Acidimicrobiales bacterium]